MCNVHVVLSLSRRFFGLSLQFSHSAQNIFPAFDFLKVKTPGKLIFTLPKKFNNNEQHHLIEEKRNKLNLCCEFSWKLVTTDRLRNEHVRIPHVDAEICSEQLLLRNIAPNGAIYYDWDWMVKRKPKTCCDWKIIPLLLGYSFAEQLFNCLWVFWMFRKTKSLILLNNCTTFVIQMAMI